jgi:acetolactate synthase-1/2/3 large subunit
MLLKSVRHVYLSLRWTQLITAGERHRLTQAKGMWGEQAMAGLRGADIVGRALAAAGASHAFGIPGGEILALLEGLDAAGIEFMLVRHENSGGFMAEGIWHMTGALPVLVATLGPGVANAVNVVANAAQDRVPLIF